MKIFGKIFFIIFCTHLAKSHDNKTVHPRVTEISFSAFAGEPTNLLPHDHSQSDQLNFNVFNQTSHSNLTPKEWFSVGSEHEDSPDLRCLAHFYNPINTAHPELKDPRLVNLGGRHALDWATTGQSYTPLGFLTITENQYSWKKAQEYYFEALTSNSKLTRDQFLGKTFYSLGHVVHLLQDLSQPEHTRNDAHMINGEETPGAIFPINLIIPKARWIENFGANQIDKLLPAGTSVEVLDWRRAKFKRMKDFWDRDLYNGEGDRAALEADAKSFKAGGDPTKLLGLAEFTHGNFLGQDH